ncbi:MAG: RNA-binding cell elongation regulator Jag/EloR [Clostridium sp.]|uniref:RNA-binding cell elongation regulator Jag/EloR n=1 Tax=Clostridium sp. TaxID=1506 RepID=UPI002FC82022
MKFIEVTGKNVDDAIKSALNELNVTKDKVVIDIIDEGSKGFLNLIGTKPAKVKVTVKRDYIDDANKFIRDVLDSMGILAEITITEENNTVKIDLTGPKMGLIIGYRGETLDSLQYLISLVINKGHDIPYKKVVLDTENYRAKREETLKRVALKTASKVKRSKRPFKLEPMNPYERRIIHAALQDSVEISTYSEGDEPFRRVVVALSK